MIGEKIKEVRKRQGLTQRELAEKMGTTQQNLAQYESGKRYPKLVTIEKIASALKVPLNTLLDGNWQPYTKEITDSLDTVTEAIEQVTTLGDDMMQDKIIENFNKVSPEGKQKIFEYSQDISENPKYRKDTE